MPLAIGSQCLWFNNCVSIDKKKDILDESGNIKTWENILQQHKINKQLYFKWLQLIHLIPNLWKKEIVYDNGNCKNLLLLNHHLIKNNQLHDVEKLKAKELYSFSIFLKNTKPTSQKYFQDYFGSVQWSKLWSVIGHDRPDFQFDQTIFS